MYIFMSVNMYATRRCTHGVPMVYPYPQYPWLTQPEGRRVRVLTGMGTGQPGITRGLPVLIPNKDYEAWCHTQLDVPVKVLHSDRGGEYLGREFILYLNSKGTTQKLTVHDTPQHNGVAEHCNRTI